MLRFKLHAKFLLLVLGSLVLFLGILSAVVVQREARLLEETTEEKQHLIAFTLFSDLKSSMLQGTPRSTLDLIETLRGTNGLVRLSVLRPDGTPAFGQSGVLRSLPRFEDVSLRAEEVSYLEEGPPPLHTILYPLKNERACSVCHDSADKVLGVLVVSLSRENALHKIRTASRDIALLLSALALMIGGVLYLVIRMVVLKPLATLNEGAERIGRGDLTHRITMSAKDELQDLATAFNLMAGRLEESREGLENKIRERTVQLHDSVLEVQDKARRLYAYSRDMATISRLSRKVFNTEMSLDELLDQFLQGVTRGLGYERIMFCLVDRKRVWLDVKRDTGIGEVLQFHGKSLLSNDPLISLVRIGKVESRTVHELRTSGPALTSIDRDGRPFYIIPLLNRSHSKTCWQITSCIKTECPAYREHSTSCWLMENTHCGNPLFETHGNKLAYCMTCQVFPVMGLLIVAAHEKRTSTERRQLSVLRILAAEMAAALENHRLHDDNRQMVRELLELHRVTASALSDLSLTKALEVFTDSALKFTGIDASAFWLTSADGRELVRKAGGCVDSDEKLDLCPDRLPVDEGLIGRALHQNNFVIDYNVPVNDATPLHTIGTTYGMRSLLAIGLKSEGGPIGVFSVHKRSPLPFLETEIAAFMLLANQAAMVIDVCLLNEELKSQNRELARHTNLLSGILSSMSSGVMLLDDAGTVVLVNLAGASILKSRREDLMNKRLTELFPETAAFVQRMDGPNREIEVRLSNGSTLPIGYSSADYQGAAGEYDGVLVVYQDLSEIKTLQTELLNKERFAAMGKVVSGVAHEIRNPLFGISSVGQILERELDSPAHRELVRALLGETKRMNQLVEELLLYGRPMNLRLEHCDVAALWNEVIAMHSAELERRGIRLSGDVDFRPVPAYLDANQIRQVFLNLLRNAIDATPADGEINVRLLLEDRFIHFKIADTGIGIPENNLDKIFDLFFTTKPKGTGLGLAICKKIVQDHGGDIAVSSVERKGTAVTVKLPYRGTTEQHELLGSRS